jgi:Melibiase
MAGCRHANRKDGKTAPSPVASEAMELAPGRSSLHEGSLDLTWPGCAAFLGVRVICKLADGSHIDGEELTEAPAGDCFQCRCGPLAVDLRISFTGSRMSCRMALRATQAVDIAAVSLTGQLNLDSDHQGWLFQNGYQSWDDSQRLPITLKPVGTGEYESWWTFAVAGEDGKGLAGAAASAATSCTRFQLNGSRLTISCCEAQDADPDRPLVTLASGNVWEPDVLFLGAGFDVRNSLANLITQVDLIRPPVRVPRGWLSWYHFGPWVTPADILANARALRTDVNSARYWLVQVDDGWQDAYGDWIPNRKFPGGLASLSHELRELGFETGAWIAPFLVSATSELAQTAPEEWFFRYRRAETRYVDARHMSLGPMFALDCRRPEVCQHLYQVFDRLYTEGIRYFKVDFLYAGAYAGLQSLHQGLAAIRRAVRDSYLLGCGAPLLPVSQWVDGCRIGPDVATPWYDVGDGSSQPTIFGDEIPAIGRAVAARSLLFPWFQLDTDVALVGGNLSLEQGRQLVTLAALSGGPFLTGDDLPHLDPERRVLLLNPEVLELIGGKPAQSEWSADSGWPPTLWRRDDVFAFFNWEATEREFELQTPRRTDAARDLWERCDLPAFEGRLRVRVPANGVRLLRLMPSVGF